MIFLALLAALLFAGAAYETLGGYLDRRRFPPRGRILPAGSLRLHIDEQGAGTPAVILEAGIAASSLSWTLVQPLIAKFTRVVSYDRTGLGWSSGCSLPRTLPAMLNEFDSLLASAALPPPYILVGHSFGGLLVRAWAFHHPDRVAGLVFIDPVSLEYWGACPARERKRLAIGASLARRGKLLSRFGIVRAALAALAAGGKTLPMLIGRATARPAMSAMQRLAGEIRKLPPETWPVIRSHWSRAKCLGALAAYLDCLPQAAHEALAMPIPPAIPFIVLSAANATPAERAERNSWVQASAHARHELLPNTGHWIPFERPDAVVSAVEELVRQSRRRPFTEV
ncbi:MAG: alpha/beta fold hydrolase [Bryobacteraceae bacterium]